MFRSAPRQSVPQNVLFSSSQTYTQGCGLLKFFLVIFWTSLSSRKFSAYSSLQYSPSQKSHGRKHSSVLLPSVTFWHHEVSSSYHHYIRNTLVKRKLSSVLPQSIMFCPLICTSLTMFSPHVTISKEPHEWGLFQSSLIQLCSETFSWPYSFQKVLFQSLPTPEIFKEIPRSGN